jgi:hypothetical protein
MSTETDGWSDPSTDDDEQSYNESVYLTSDGEWFYGAFDTVRREVTEDDRTVWALKPKELPEAVREFLEEQEGLDIEPDMRVGEVDGETRDLWGAMVLNSDLTSAELERGDLVFAQHQGTVEPEGDGNPYQQFEVRVKEADL